MKYGIPEILFTALLLICLLLCSMSLYAGICLLKVPELREMSIRLVGDTSGVTLSCRTFSHDTDLNPPRKMGGNALRGPPERIYPVERRADSGLSRTLQGP